MVAKLDDNLHVDLGIFSLGKGSNLVFDQKLVNNELWLPTGAEVDLNARAFALMGIRANIHVALQGKATTLDAATLSVTPQGAVVVMKQNLPAETRLVLEHGGTKQRVDCKVARPSRETAEGFHIPLEFDSPAPGFWKINFPPSDWRPDDQ